MPLPDDETTDMLTNSLAGTIHSLTSSASSEASSSTSSAPFVCRCSTCIREYAARVHKKTESLCQRLYVLFTRHPHEKQMSYAQHALYSLRMALHMGKGAIGLCIHSIFPFLCEKTGTRTVDMLHTEIHHTEIHHTKKKEL